MGLDDAMEDEKGVKATKDRQMRQMRKGDFEAYLKAREFVVHGHEKDDVEYARKIVERIARCPAWPPHLGPRIYGTISVHVSISTGSQPWTMTWILGGFQRSWSCSTVWQRSFCWKMAWRSSPAPQCNAGTVRKHTTATAMDTPGTRPLPSAETRRDARIATGV